MTFKQMLDKMILEGYVKVHKGKPVFTDKARMELDAQPLIRQLPVPPPPPARDYEEQYKEFILFCKIPPVGRDSVGNPYAMNKFSREGAEAFRKALQKGIDLRILVLSVALYYKTPGFKKSIGNYMSTGEWQTDYDALLEQQRLGTLPEHLKKQTNGSPSWFTTD